MPNGRCSRATARAPRPCSGVASRPSILISLALSALTTSGAWAAETETVAYTVEARAGNLFAERFELVDLSAWTLRAGELEIGLTNARVGFLDLFQVGTRFALNLVGALNADAKWTIYDGDHLAIGVEGGLLHFDPELVGIDADFSVWAFPVALRASGRPADVVRIHGALEFLSARPSDELSDAAKRIQRYLGPVGRLALVLGGEWRATDLIALVADVSIPLMLHHESLRYEGEDGAGDFVTATVAMQLVYEAFNLRVGGGYGPSFLGRSGPFPVFEMSLRVY